jgi:hypothetical protein
MPHEPEQRVRSLLLNGLAGEEMHDAGGQRNRVFLVTAAEQVLAPIAAMLAPSRPI